MGQRLEPGAGIVWKLVCRKGAFIRCEPRGTEQEPEKEGRLSLGENITILFSKIRLDAAETGIANGQNGTQNHKTYFGMRNI